MSCIKYNVFISTTPFQLEYCRLIISKCFSDNKYYNLLYCSDLPEGELHRVDELCYADKSSFISQLWKMKSAVSRIKEISKQENVEFFFVHTSGVLANYCYFKYVKNKGLRFSLFYEGILSFYYYEEKFKIVHLKRKISGVALGINYRFSSKIVPLSDKRLKSYYTPFPAYSKGNSSKMRNVRFERKLLDDQCKNGLILGGLSMSKSEKYEWSKIVYSYLMANDLERVYFKRHPDDVQGQFYGVLASTSVEILEINERQGIEWLIDRYDISSVLSLQISSALFNLRAIYGSSIKLYYKSPTNIPENLKNVYDCAAQENFIDLK